MKCGPMQDAARAAHSSLDIADVHIISHAVQATYAVKCPRVRTQALPGDCRGQSMLEVSF